MKKVAIIGFLVLIASIFLAMSVKAQPKIPVKLEWEDEWFHQEVEKYLDNPSFGSDFRKFFTKKLKKAGFENITDLHVYQAYFPSTKGERWNSSKMLATGQALAANSKWEYMNAYRTYNQKPAGPSNWKWRAKFLDLDSGIIYKVAFGKWSQSPQYIIEEPQIDFKEYRCNETEVHRNYKDILQDTYDKFLLEDYAENRDKKYIPVEEYQIYQFAGVRYLPNTLEELEKDYVKWCERDGVEITTEPLWHKVKSNHDLWIELRYSEKTLARWEGKPYKELKRWKYE